MPGLAGGGASIANRVSYFCGFHGPSMTVDTACSGSLTALHLAGAALRAGEIDAALVGGANLSLHPNKYLTLSQGNFLSSKGRCESFGAGGDGYVPGEGVGVLFLRRLRDAELDGDHIYGVIRGTAINHGGRASGYTAPNPSAQRRVVAAALRNAGVAPSTISYVEAHGTGTKLGDPIELAGLSAVFDAGNSGESVPRQSCAIGSVKSNIGHCEAAAGVAGVTKVLLQFQHGQLVPSLHADPPNAEIDFPATPFVVNQDLRPWPRLVRDGRELPRRAAVSSFGAGGANAHVVLEEYRAEDRPAADAGPAVVVLSARSRERLLAYVRDLRTFLDRDTTGSVDDSATAPATRSVAELRELLRCMVADLLDVDPAEISPDTARAELGFDHIAEARLLERIDQRLGVVLSIGDLDRCLTTGALAEHLHRISSAAPDSAPPRHAVRLADVAHTLQIGRIALDERLAVVAKDVPELITELDHFLDGVASQRLHQGNIRSADATRARSLLGGTAGARFVRDLLDSRDLGTAAQAWVCGLEVDWRMLYQGGAPARISLPTYPFARERYWITDEFAKLGKPAPATPIVDGPWAPALAARVAEQIAGRPSTARVSIALAGFLEHERVSAELGRICAFSLYATLCDLGPFPGPGERVDRAWLRDELGIVPQHHGLFDGLIDILATEGLLLVDGDLITVLPETASAIEPEELARRCELLIAEAEDTEAPLRVLRSCLAGYPDVLTGRRSAGEVLFPGGSFDAIEEMSRSQREGAALVARAVRDYVADRLRLDPDDRISVLEVGAGVGATTTAVAEAIAEFGARVSYVCTDGSAAFTRYSAGRLATRFPFLRFQELDVERPPVGQGYPARDFDVVVAGNALHATTDIQRALGHVKSLLRGNGLLVFAETTRDHPLPTLVLGLTPGWWAAQDDRPLDHSPLLTVSAWRSAVERAGFRTVRVLSPQPVAEELLPDAVFLAESDAVVPEALLTVPSPAAEPTAAEPTAGAEPEDDELTDTEAMVLAAWQEVLGVPSLARDVDFTELGGDSIMRTRVMSRLRARFPFELELAGLLEAGTIGEMARVVETELIEKIDALPDDAAHALAME